ncbi:MAG: PhoX family phosphatase [Deltaproteobacteria bacterium]|nr:PhoX family phosphatase [Deltaproteobacteria bacterium]
MAGLVLALAGPPPCSRAQAAGSPGFAALTHSTEDRLLVPAGYAYSVVVRWGDPVIPGAPGLDPRTQTPRKQALQFGYNCDCVGFLPLPRGARSSARGLLVVNHEYTNPGLMFPRWDGRIERKTREMVEIELAAHGVSVVEAQREASGAWRYVRRSPYNRRLTGETRMAISGPAAGHPWLKSSYDSAGTLVRGTLNNCSGGTTPWGTVLTCEENFHFYFGGTVEGVTDQSIRAVHRRYGVQDLYGWARHHTRFDMSREPHEPLRFGWVVEVDPYDPSSVPVKRTALGRFKHEAATVVLARRGHVVVYSGDDEPFEYLYKFVSAGRYDPANRAGNLRLLDAGTLYVARFRDDGTGEWLPLRFGQGPLIPANGFASQAEVLINARRAADLLGATKMDRPEDVAVHPQTGKVYAVMTNNIARGADQVDRANPRPDNRFGHIIELSEEAGEHTATRFRWGIFIACGNPNNPHHRAYYQGHKDVSWLATPDNVAFDAAGRLWITTDGQPAAIKANDGVYVVETEGPGRGLARMFLSGPVGCEVCGPAFTPDNRTFFVAIQHPGEAPYEESGRGKASTFANPISRFPDYRADMPPRPSVVAIYRQDGGKVGS